LSAECLYIERKQTVNLFRLVVKRRTALDDLQAPGSSFVNTNGSYLASTSVMSPHMSSWHMAPDRVTASQAGADTLSSSLNDSYLSSYFSRSAALSTDAQQVYSFALSRV